jgi:glycosyltransferase involved in cell wall biosynthesis
MLDVVIFCEGTYPYVSGGVSSWIHALISGMPELTFGLVFLAPTRNFNRHLKYKLPPNVRELVELYIYDLALVETPEQGDVQAAWKAVEDFFAGLARGKVTHFDRLLAALCPKSGPSLISLSELAYSRQSWNILLRTYNQHGPDVSFVDFFWTWRFIHFPLFQLLNAPILEARVYHTVTTGWSGFLATLARLRSGRPMVLTEHGIYTNERRIEVVTADWIHVEAFHRGERADSLGVLKTLWINLFQSLGQLCYDWADSIYTLFEDNRRLQLEAGAPAEKIEIIPNGVMVPPVSRASKEEPFRIGFVGRVVPIKDVKTFLLACRQVQAGEPEARVYVIGPTEEDPDYFQECLSLSQSLGLEGFVTFTGPQNVQQWYPTLDVLVLTSVSEGQPLVILEAYCYEVPCVATEVGCCSELIFGREGEDRQLGAAGFVTPVASPRETAAAILQLAHSPELRQRQGMAGRRRVERYYDQVMMLERYRRVYTDNMKKESRLGGHRLQA